MAAAKNTFVDEIPTEFDWLTLHDEMDKLCPVAETAKEKFIRKVNENPFVPFGCLCTATALTLGLKSFHKGDSKLSQKMMRLRIAAQGFTVLALIGGILSASTGSNINIFKKKND